MWRWFNARLPVVSTGKANETACAQYVCAAVYAGLGDKDAAFAALERVVKYLDPGDRGSKGRPATRQLALRPKVPRLAGQ
jgi:hypothetical protein